VGQLAEIPQPDFGEGEGEKMGPNQISEFGEKLTPLVVTGHPVG